MKRSNLATSVLSALICCSLLSAVGCSGTLGAKPPPPQVWKSIDTTESAVLVPLVGDTKQQVSAQTEAFFKANQVFAKNILIPQNWRVDDLYTGRGHWVDGARLITVDRKLVNRTWTKDPGSGTSVRDQSIEAEDLASIGFRAHITCTAGVDEPDVPKFLFRFKQSDLEHVMDENVRPMVAELFVAECNKYPMMEILKNRQKIMDNVRQKVIPYFKEMGVDIQILGLVGELTYINPAAQESIDRVFQANQDTAAAAAKAETARLLATPANMEYMRLQLEQKKLDIAMKQAEKWNGQMPQYMTGSGSGLNMFINPSK